MFILFGTKMKEEAVIPLPKYTCSHCSTNTLQLHIITKRFSAYNIISFPFETVPVVACTQCQHTMLMPELPVEMKEDVGKFYTMYRPTNWHFAGVALTVFILCLLTVLFFIY